MANLIASIERNNYFLYIQNADNKQNRAFSCFANLLQSSPLARSCKLNYYNRYTLLLLLWQFPYSVIIILLYDAPGRLQNKASSDLVYLSFAAAACIPLARHFIEAASQCQNNHHHRHSIQTTFLDVINRGFVGRRSVGRDTAMSGGLRQKAASNNIEETWNKHSPRTLTHPQCGYIMYLNLSLFFFVSPIPPPFLLLFLLLPIHRARTAPASFVARLYDYLGTTNAPIPSQTLLVN